MLGKTIHDAKEDIDYKIVGLSNRKTLPIMLVDVKNPMAITFCTVSYVKARIND